MESPIFVGGVPRSGTTLLRVILDTHPRIHCGTEMRVINALARLWSAVEASGQPLLSEAYAIEPADTRRHFAALIRAFLEPGRRASGKPRVAEKTPSNLLVFPELAALFPGSPLVHVIRDGRDVVASRLERDRPQGVPLSAEQSRALAAIRATEWVDAMRLRSRILADAALSRNYVEVRYESLIEDPERALRDLFERLGESFDPAVLSFHEVEREVQGTEEWSAEAVSRPIFRTSIGRWRRALTADELGAVQAVAGETLVALGYAAGLAPA